jgi:AcrR family transcriptional regulator
MANVPQTEGWRTLIAMSSNARRGQSVERADARRNRQLLLDAAASCVAEQGLSVAALDIAERAGVGVATLYRRFTTKEALIEQILLDIFAALEDAGAQALEHSDPWQGFEVFIRTIARMTVQNAGLAQALESVATPKVARGQMRIRLIVKRLTTRAQKAGVLRSDISWADVVFIPKAVLTSSRCLGLDASVQSPDRTLTLLLDGLRTPLPSPLPGRPPAW